MIKSKIKYVLLILIVGYSASYIYNNTFTPSMLQGIYVNKNYRGSRFPPKSPDTLYLKEGGRLESLYFGISRYEVKYSVGFTEIILFNSRDNSYFKTQVSRRYLGKPRIIVSSDYSHWYKKISSLPSTN